MVIGIIGENCSGKSTLASKIQSTLGGEIVTGRDYLRMARLLFQRMQRDAVHGGHVIFVISEPEQIRFLPDEAVRVLVKADLDTIKERFKAGMRGTLSAAVEKMLERNHGCFDDIAADHQCDGVNGNAGLLCAKIAEKMGEGQH